MSENFKGFDNFDNTVRKSAVIQERMGLISTHMYQQFLEYKQSNSNMIETLEKIAENAAMTINYFRQSCASRGMPVQNISIDYDKSRHSIDMNILWHKIGIAALYSENPKVLLRENEKDGRIVRARIIAIRGSFSDFSVSAHDEYMQKLLNLEVASLYIPADKTVSAIIKIKHLGNKEFQINQMDAPREFLLKVVEIICGGGDFHEESTRKTISI